MRLVWTTALRIALAAPVAFTRALLRAQGLRRRGKNSMKLTPIMVGAAAGALAGILLAPRAGRVTRRQIRSKALQGTKFTRDHLNRAVQSAGATIEQGRRHFNSHSKRIQDALDTAATASRKHFLG
jgi:gas vesicle protein